tara:strand:+ start:148 stop:420 length:273 start_codon:yes stop_codon:yes gene_type:complete
MNQEGTEGMNNKRARQVPYERGTLLKGVSGAGLYLVTGKGIARVKHGPGRSRVRQEAYSFSARCNVIIYISGYTPVDGSGPVWEVWEQRT